MNITDFLTIDSGGDLIQPDTNGNNIAFNCITCFHPILASSKHGEPGSHEEYPVTCKGCGQKSFLDVRERAEKLYIHVL